MTKTSSIVVCSPFFNFEWDWFASEFSSTQLKWFFYNNKKQGFLEKLIKVPDLAMIRSCYQAVKFAKENQSALIISHDPRVTFWSAVWSAIMQVDIENLAYSFNFPELPHGLKRIFMIQAFKKIERFIVFSKVEKKVYSEYFGIPAEKIHFVLWSMDTPTVEPQEPLEKGDYICTIGGNARDYQTLMTAMEKVPDLPLVMVVRPDNLEGLKIPPNVKVLVNIPFGQAMNILKYSRFMVLPLKNSNVPCGHVTLVAAMHLGKAFVITNSQGVSDYVIPDYNAIFCEALAPEKLAEAISQLWHDPDKCQFLSRNGLEFAQKYCSEEFAREELRQLLIEKQLILDQQRSFSADQIQVTL